MKPAARILTAFALVAAGCVASIAIGRVTLAQRGAAPTLTAQDQLEIRALIDRYPHVLDNCTNNGNDYADMFTPDAAFGVSQEFGTAKIWFRGREQLRRAGGGTDSGCRPRRLEGYAFHVPVNPVITPTPAGAHAITTLLTITNDTDSRGDIAHWEGWYEDTFEKTASGWKFKSRVHVWPEIEWTDRVEDMPPRRLEDE